ncbi:unnamed protein product [Oikopleura dioica]|uniref:Uncharacterized protein n=1 Tax=Oikopleura dioica TaxID=34765 RepID=E4XAI9_OIKDI|nr:unnamed protein product [Oikopleura dioica]
MHISKFDPRLDELLNSEQVVLRSDSGAIVASTQDLEECECSVLQVSFKLLGGKGGFGSLLRAIGSQIHNTTDRKSCRNLDGTRIRSKEYEKDLVEAKKRKIEKDKQVAIEREEKRQKKMETIVKTAAGEHGGKHYFEDEEYVESKEKSTAQTAESVALAAAKLRKQAEEKRRKDEEARRIREQSAGDDTDSDCSSLEDEFMPVKSVVNTGPTRPIKGGSATASVKTASHSDAMYSHLLGKNVGERKPFELHKVQDIELEALESIDSLMSESLERLGELLMLRGLKATGTIPERADRLWKVRGLSTSEYPEDIVAKR